MFGMGLMLGLDTLVAQAYGRKDHDECHRWLAQGVYLACICRRADYGWDRAGELVLCALRNCGGSGRAGERDICGWLLWGTLPLLLYSVRCGGICRAWARCA